MVDTTSRLNALVVLVALVPGCKDPPAPLGKLTPGEIASWAEDCPAEIEQRPAKPGRAAAWVDGKGEDRTTFARAAHMFVCKRPGWEIYTDKNDRVVGACVDNNVYEKLGDLDRARPIFSKHWGPKLAEEMTQGICSSITERLGAFWRWHRYLGYVTQPDGTVTKAPNTGALWSCCWEVAE